jgi:hypothetical protein
MPENSHGQSPKKPEHPAEAVNSDEPASEGVSEINESVGIFRVRKWMRSDHLHKWIQSAGLMVATVWGFYTFVYKDILIPSWAPAHINLNVSLSPVEGRSSSSGGSEMTLKVTATNTSGRKLYLLNNTWQLFGVERKAVAEQKMVPLGNEALLGLTLVQVERFVINKTGPTLALGRIFIDNTINPGETIERTVLVRIPTGYEAAEVDVLLPTLTKEPNEQLFSGCRLVWQLTANEDILPMLVRDSNAASSGTAGSNTECKNDENLDLDATLRKFDPLMQMFSSSKQFGIPIESSDANKAAKTPQHSVVMPASEAP